MKPRDERIAYFSNLFLTDSILLEAWARLYFRNPSIEKDGGGWPIIKDMFILAQEVLEEDNGRIAG